MASKASLLFALSLLFTACLARQRQQQQDQCQLRNIEALEPYDIIQAEAGVTEIWDADNQQFQCAGVDFIRHRIQPGGLLLPSYVNTPILAFIERGRGVNGVILPGCRPETYEYSQDQQFSGERRGQEFESQDRHQKVEELNQGDVVAIPTGAAHWLHNDGDSELVAVVFFDTQSYNNQLDEYHRRFFLAGNPQAQSQQHQQGRPQIQRQQQQGRPRRQGQWQGRQFQNSGNIFNGFDAEFIAEAFNVDRDTAEKLQGQRDQRGHIVKAQQGLQIILPQQTRQHQQSRRGSSGPFDPRQQHQGRRGSGGWSNGFEETICSLKLKENIENPSHADFVNPQAGKISNLNSFKFPILKHLQLSAERGELQRNAIQSPHWTINAHNLLYVTEGNLRVQIVNNEGNSVFDNELWAGQVVVIPQNFAVIKRAGEQGAKWVSFKTNDNAMIANLVGRVSAISSLPVDVVANSYQLSREDAQRLKFSQRETVLFNPNYRSQGKASA
ncbi:hypothetical protein L1987_86070 [Smallanthus sonchifolius]|uniref:Uncharacterized protein n=1 Tax=Smallanthus sonchifolius TaxID=185202 RepID=A0ACB8XZC0_9ASTR|nr:hypothetical protein L1987_86070 [Smallanthus sonchifolius]